MTESIVESILPADLQAKALTLKNAGYHIVQMCAVRKPAAYELSYSFAKEYDMINIRFTVAEDDEVITISNIFAPAFLYENEIRDLFGVKIKMISLDYEGNLYRIDAKTPFKN